MWDVVSKKSKRVLRDLARQRFYSLLDVSEELARQGDWEVASKIGKHAFKLAKKGGYRIPSSVKRRFCRRCSIPLIPSVTARVRLRNKGRPTVVISCLNCGYVRRYPVGSKYEGSKENSDTSQSNSSHRQKRVNRTST